MVPMLGGGVDVQPSGCLGNCSQAPNVLVVANQNEQLFAQVCDLAKSAAVVERAAREAPSLEDPQMLARLSRARRIRVRNQAREESKWNLALAGFDEDMASAKSQEDREELIQEHAELLAAAGFPDRAIALLDSGIADLDQLSLANIPQLRLLIAIARIAGEAGRIDDRDLKGRVALLQPRGSQEARVKAQVMGILQECETTVPARKEPQIQNYALWHLDSVTPVSKHSAIYHFRSDDERRGTPIARGRRKRIQWVKTWHTTMLAHVGEEANTEGPLPWVERDYTPISTAHDWEEGRCDILIKIYLESEGLGTSWLHRISAQLDGAAQEKPTVWLSKPMKTMSVPSLSVEDKHVNRKHLSVLLLVAGTGVVAVPQVLHHAHQATCFDLNKTPPITSPVSVIYSCRRDDVLLASELATWCKEGMLQRCVVLTTETQASNHPFPEAGGTNLTGIFSDLPNVVCVESRVSVDLLRDELAKLETPRRIVVSGPDTFNGAAKRMLEQLGVEAEAITILSA